MSFNDYKPAWKAEGLTATERLVLLNLAEHRNGDKDSENFNLCFPGYTTIMKETGLGRGSVSRAIKGLKAKLPLNVAVDLNNRLSNRYSFPWNEEDGCSLMEHPVPQGNTLFPNGTPCSTVERSVPQVDYNKEPNQESKKEENTEYNSSAAAVISSTPSQDEQDALDEVYAKLGMKPGKPTLKLLSLLRSDRVSVLEILSYPLLITKLKQKKSPVNALIHSVKEGYAKDWMEKAEKLEARKSVDPAPPTPASPPTDYSEDMKVLDELDD